MFNDNVDINNHALSIMYGYHEFHVSEKLKVSTSEYNVQYKQVIQYRNHFIFTVIKNVTYYFFNKPRVINKTF